MNFNASCLPLHPTNTLVVKRRTLLRIGASSVGAFALNSSVLAQQKVIKIGSTLDISGVEKANGLGLVQGAKAYFQRLNKSGGINGVPVELIVEDDKFQPNLSKDNALKLLSDNAVIALMSTLGTRQTAAVMEAVSDVAIVGPSTGTLSLRKKNAQNTFFTKANYDQEVDKLIATAVSQGFTRIGIVHPKDPLGESVLAAFNTSMGKFNLKPHVVATTPGTISPEVQPAADAIAKAAPQMVFVCLAGTSVPFIKALRKTGNTSTVFGLSIMASPSNIQNLGDLSRGLGFSIVVPSPFSSKFEMVRQYRQDMQASNSNEFSLISLEGWINARVLSEGLRKAGSNVNRQSLLSALERIESLDLGGLRIGYGKTNREGGNFVDVAVIGLNGQMLT